MRPKQPETTRSGDLFRARLDQIINLKHELAQRAGQVDWDFIDGDCPALQRQGSARDQQRTRSRIIKKTITSSVYPGVNPLGFRAGFGINPQRRRSA
jgi:hypothetical protein